MENFSLYVGTLILTLLFHLHIIVFVLVLDVQCSSFWCHHLLMSYTINHISFFSLLCHMCL